MTAPFERKHASKLVSGNHRVLIPLLITVAVVNSATLGCDSFVMNGLLIPPSYPEYFHLNTATEDLNNVAVWLGGIVGAFLMQPVPDYFGRRRAIYGRQYMWRQSNFRATLGWRSSRQRLTEGGWCTLCSMVNMFGNFIISFCLGKILTQAGIRNRKTQTQVQVILNCWVFAVAVVGSFMLDILGRGVQTFIGVGGMMVTLLMIGGLIKPLVMDQGFGESTNKSGIYGTIAVIFFFQAFYTLSITPMTSLYPTEVSPFKLRATGIAIFRMLDAGFGLLASFSMAYAMADLSWKFYFINAAWNYVFLIIAYFTFVETKGLTLEEIIGKFERSEDVIVGTVDSSYVNRPDQRIENWGGSSRRLKKFSNRVADSSCFSETTVDTRMHS